MWGFRNIKTDRINTVVFNLHQIKQSSFSWTPGSFKYFCMKLSDSGHCLKVIGIRPLAHVQNSVSLKLMQLKTLNFVIKLPDVENITK